VDPAVHIWNRSVHANVLYGAEDTECSFPEAIASADLRQVIERLPEGLQTHLGEGGALISGGEGQRVRFARALARDQVRLVILDEPFRGLDREKRRMLMERARDYWNDRTLICITHDVAETKSFDRVVVVENGQITEQGAPEELACDQESRYAQLLFSEKQLRSGLWSSKLWRRIRMQNGRLIEDANAIWIGDSTRDARTSYTEEKAS
jgi:ATP-binding cassette subfamily B protein